MLLGFKASLMLLRGCGVIHLDFVCVTLWTFGFIEDSCDVERILLIFLLSLFSFQEVVCCLVKPGLVTPFLLNSSTT